MQHITSEEYLHLRSKVEAAHTIEELIVIMEEVRNRFLSAPIEDNWITDSLVVLLQKRAREIHYPKK